eukprot:TRINITY_DN64670_c0_g1_i2.p1 TRINITY_DN64670_c0_g1~~TRINITY_DN64670_c0_g1_i2.p1  ORF type:complete len:691 (-),score=102.23 TRINITY_DN64670_c0_g1_i2:116-2188(-)
MESFLYPCRASSQAVLKDHRDSDTLSHIYDKLDTILSAQDKIRCDIAQLVSDNGSMNNSLRELHADIRENRVPQLGKRSSFNRLGSKREGNDGVKKGSTCQMDNCDIAGDGSSPTAIVASEVRSENGHCDKDTTTPATDSCPSEPGSGDPFFVGTWRDRTGSFYGGQIITIRADSWEPGSISSASDIRGNFKVDVVSALECDLIETCEVGGSRLFRLSMFTSGEKCVRISYESMNGFEMEWILHAASDKVETVHVLGDDHAQKIKMSCVLNQADTSVDPYKSTGCAQRIVRNSTFETVSLSVVVLNAFWIAIDTDHNDSEILAEAAWPFQVMENIFCTFFVFEWIVRFMAAAKCSSLIRDPWFVFDSFLVGLMVFETWVMTIIVLAISGSNSPITSVAILRMFRLMRLTRLNRMVRVLRFVPEVLFMVKGAFKASRSVLVTLAMLMFVVYIFGIAFKQLSEGYDFGALYFSSVPSAIYTLLMDATLLDSTGAVMNAITSESIVCSLMFALVILLAAFTVMNMLIGVLCEVVSNVSAEEKDKMDVNFVKDKVFEILASQGLDKRAHRTISKQEFLHLLEAQASIKVLREVGVDPCTLVDFADFFFQSDRLGFSFDKQIEYDEFIEAVMKLRAGAPSSVEDVMYLKKFVRDENMSVYAKLDEVHNRVKLLVQCLAGDASVMLPKGNANSFAQ